MAHRRLKRLHKEAQSSLLAAQEFWTAQAMTRLSTPDLKHIEAALERGFDPRKEQHDVPITPAEKAAFERFNACYEEARHGV